MLKTYFEDYRSVNLADYENIGVDFEISKFLLIVLLALCVSFFVIDWHRGYMLLAVKKLFRHEAVSPESAKTLKELGLDGSKSVKWALSTDTRLSKIVSYVGKPQYTYEEYMALVKERKKSSQKFEEEKPNLNEARFYITERYMDEAKGIEQNYSSSFIKTTLFSLMFIIIFVGITLIMPELLYFINSSMAN